MNVSDSDRMRASLIPLGFEEIKDPVAADLVLINTCSVREKAEEKTSSFAYDLRRYKEKNPNKLIGVTGCVAQQEKEKLLTALPFIDFVLGPDNIDDLPQVLEQSIESKIVKAEFDTSPRLWNMRTTLMSSGPTAFLSIMKGCDHFCSYCIVPYTRGREKSRPIVDIVEDVKSFVSQGVREVTFLGQNINTFGKRAGESLAELFHRVHDIEGLERIRFTTSHPGDIQDELIRCFEELPKLASQFHLPVQSGSNRILRAMRRFYTRELYLERATALRQARPDIAFSTDMIIGFPGETEEDFLQTLELSQQMKYENAYSFLYSRRPGTTAALKSDLTPESVKMERLSRFQKQQQGHSREFHEAQLGLTQTILIEGTSKKNSERFTGRSSHNTPVHIPKDFIWKKTGLPISSGDMVPVKITEATMTHLRGEPIEEQFECLKTTTYAQTSSPITA